MRSIAGRSRLGWPAQSGFDLEVFLHVEAQEVP